VRGGEGEGDEVTETEDMVFDKGAERGAEVDGPCCMNNNYCVLR